MDAMADPTVRARMTKLGREIFPRESQAPEALGAMQRAEHDHLTGTMDDLFALALGTRRHATAVEAHARGLRASRVRAILTEIKAEFTNPACSARHIASKLGLSLRYLQDLMHDTGTSFTEQVMNLRLQRSRAMLGNPRYDGCKVIEIAHRCGFNEVSHFNRSFRRRFGVSPTEFRTGKARGSAPSPPRTRGLATLPFSSARATRWRPVAASRSSSGCPTTTAFHRRSRPCSP